MMAEPPSFKLSVILRASLLVVLGVFLGIYVTFTGNSAYMGLKNDKGQTLANVHVEEESASVSQCSLHAESENNKVHRQQYDVKFPYNAYNRFCTGWNAIIEEYEWSYKHLRQESTYSGIYKSLSLGPESFTPISVSKSRVYLQDQTSTYRKGDFIQVIIEAKDEHGNPRLRGGDFLVGVMWNEKLQKYTAGRSVDYGNGTYSMFFYAAWKGAASINVTLSVPREAILFYEQMKYKDHRILWSVKFTDGSITENSNCTISNEGTWDNKCSFENHRSMGKTAIICDKPKTLNCQTLNSTSQNLTAMATLANDAVAGLSYLFERSFKGARFLASPIKVNIKDDVTKMNLPKCGPDLPVSMTSGYWTNNHTFIPMMCRSQEWTPIQRFQCSSPKWFFFVGDSTILQIRRRFADVEIIPEKPKITCNYVALRGGTPIQYVNDLIFESDFIDMINKSVCRSYTPVVMFNFCFHYASWSVRAYLDRVYQTKLSVLRLFQRCPKAIVIIKLAHPRDNIDVSQSVHSGNYMYYDMNRMLRRVFGGIGVNFLDVWDMVLSHPNKNEVHVRPAIITQIIDMMFSYICPNMVEA